MATNNAINTNIPIQEVKGGTAQSTYTTGDILYASATNTLSKLPLGNFGDDLNVSSTNISWEAPRLVQRYYNDFVSFPLADWSANGSGTGSGVSTTVPAVDNHPGIWVINTGSDTTGAQNLHLYEQSLLLSSGQILIEWLIQLPNLSTGVDRYTFRAGALDDFNPSDGSNAVFFRYVDNVNSGNFVLVARSGGSETAVNSSIAATTNWTRLSIVIVPATPIATFYVNGVSAGTVTTNIPTVNPLGMQTNIIKSAGTNSRVVFMDYAYIYNQLAVTR